jgi:hypothetical protein
LRAVQPIAIAALARERLKLENTSVKKRVSPLYFLSFYATVDR